MKTSIDRRKLLLTTSATGVAAMLAACSSPPPAPVVLAPPPAPAPPKPVQAPPPVAAQPRPDKISHALNSKDYRRDAASHLYSKNGDRIYKGKMPPLLYAVGVLQVEVDPHGHVTSTNWMRAPRHAPEVMADIERTVRTASPFPAPVRLAGVTYTDTWLWHKSGRFQLDTLTEGQS
jgi:periplasmic protein TonB